MQELSSPHCKRCASHDFNRKHNSRQRAGAFRLTNFQVRSKVEFIAFSRNRYVPAHSHTDRRQESRIMSRRRFAFVTTFVCSLLLARGAFAGLNFIGGELLDCPNPDVMQIGDLNGDSRADVVVLSKGSNELAVFIAADTESHFAPSQTLRVGQNPSNL